MKKVKNGWSRHNFLLLGSSMLVTSLGLSQLANAQARLGGRNISEYERIVRRLFAAGENKDAETFITYFTKNARYTVGNNPAVIGPDAIRESVNTYAFPVVQSFYHNIKRTWVAGDTLAVQFDLEVISLEGKPIGPFPIMDFFRFKDRLIAEMQIYGDLREIYPA